MGPLVRSFLRPGGGSLRERLAGLHQVLSSRMPDPRRQPTKDPLVQAREVLRSEPEKLKELDSLIELEISAIVTSALQEVMV